MAEGVQSGTAAQRFTLSATCSRSNSAGSNNLKGGAITGGMPIEDKYLKVISLLESMTRAQEIRGRNWAIFNYALDAVSAFGITIPRLRKLAHEIGKDHALAQRLWSDNSRETRILATMVDDPNQVTEEQMEKWASDFFYWEICDQCCMNLFDKTPFAYDKSIEWSSRDGEYVKRAAFVLMNRLALKKSNISDVKLEAFLPIIKREAHDKRRFVKSAIVGTLHRIGKHSLNLNGKAMRTAREIRELNSPSARWIGTKAINKLKGNAIQKV